MQALLQPEMIALSLPPRRQRLRQWIAALVVLWLLTGVYLVNTEQQAVVTRFGAIVEPRVLPGIHLSLPWPIDRVTRLKVQQLQRLVVGGDAADTVIGRSQPLRSQFLTGDQNIISLRAVVQYSVGSPADYLFRTSNVAQTVTAAVETALAQKVAAQPVDTVLTSGKSAIQDGARAEAQRLLDEYRTGVLVSTINIESVTPPPEAADAFRDVASARADSARIVNEAQGYANDVIPRARGGAQQLLEAAQGYRQRKIDEAQGDAARFTQVAAEYSKASEVNGQRLYLETMETILPKIKKLIVDNKGNLDLTIIRRGEK
ncbi:MAG TPA: FtsH protease activity modulator HflK [Bryobacteraceae bacterium]|nr:FtsH protease activity modulator HflK [Bryobacteraceae bacterium]